MEFEMEHVHLIALALTAIVIFFADHEGFQYFRGKKQTLDPNKLKFFHRLVWAGLLTMITTGFFMMLEEADEVLAEPVFYLKMFFVAVLILNGTLIGSLMHRATTTPFKELGQGERYRLILSGMASTLGWVGSTVIGFFFI
jgi:cation transport ATPase